MLLSIGKDVDVTNGNKKLFRGKFKQFLLSYTPMTIDRYHKSTQIEV